MQSPPESVFSRSLLSHGRWPREEPLVWTLPVKGPLASNDGAVRVGMDVLGRAVIVGESWRRYSYTWK